MINRYSFISYKLYEICAVADGQLVLRKLQVLYWTLDTEKVNKGNDNISRRPRGEGCLGVNTQNANTSFLNSNFRESRKNFASFNLTVFLAFRVQ